MGRVRRPAGPMLESSFEQCETKRAVRHIRYGGHHRPGSGEKWPHLSQGGDGVGKVLQNVAEDHDVEALFAEMADEVEVVEVSRKDLVQHRLSGFGRVGIAFDAYDAAAPSPEGAPEVPGPAPDVQDAAVRSDELHQDHTSRIFGAEIDLRVVIHTFPLDPLQRRNPVQNDREPIRCTRHGPGAAAGASAYGASVPRASRRRVAIVTSEPLTARMAGPAIRAWHMAEALGAEHEVELATTGACERFHSRFRARHVSADDFPDLERWCDVLVFQGGLLHDHPFLQQSGKVLVADVYDPFHLENFEQTRGWAPADRDRTVRRLTEVLNEQLRCGDLFLCASERQRDFWMGSLAALGRVNPANYDADPTLRSLVTVVPFGLPGGPPQKSHPAIRGVVPGISWDDKVILWAGGVYNWLDPLTLVRAVDRLRRRLPEVRLYFLGLQHPNPNIPEMRVATELRELAEHLGLVGTHVFFNDGWVDYESRADYLLEADVGVSTHLDHVETAYSFRSRILDYLWAGLPVVATGGDAFGELVEAEGLGAAVPAGDEAALEAALEELLSDVHRNKECRENAARIAPRFVWDAALEPLVAFCRDPRRAPDLAAGRAGPSPVQPQLDHRAGWVAAAPRMVAATYRDGGAPLVLRRVAGKVRRVLGAR